MSLVVKWRQESTGLGKKWGGGERERETSRKLGLFAREPRGWPYIWANYNFFKIVPKSPNFSKFYFSLQFSSFLTILSLNLTLLSKKPKLLYSNLILKIINSQIKTWVFPNSFRWKPTTGNIT